MALTAPPTIPLITDPATFAVRAQDWVVWQAEQLYPELVNQSALLGLSLTSVSTSSNTVGTGSKSFTVETGKGFVNGLSLSIAYDVTPTNRMFAVVTGYNSITGQLDVTVQAIEGSGTYTDWVIAPAFNGVVSYSQLDPQYIDDAAIVTLDPAADYFAIADGSDAGNKKKALIPIASETAIGLVGLATDAEAQAGTANKFIDGAKLHAASLGLSQTWQNVTGSRSAGVTYTNTTGKPIQVGVAVTAGSANNIFSATVGGVVAIKTQTVVSSAGYLAPLVFIVPNGISYTVTQSGSTGSVSSWAELR